MRYKIKAKLVGVDVPIPAGTVHEGHLIKFPLQNIIVLKIPDNHNCPEPVGRLADALRESHRGMLLVTMPPECELEMLELEEFKERSPNAMKYNCLFCHKERWEDEYCDCIKDQAVGEFAMPEPNPHCSNKSIHCHAVEGSPSEHECPILDVE